MQSKIDKTTKIGTYAIGAPLSLRSPKSTAPARKSPISIHLSHNRPLFFPIFREKSRSIFRFSRTSLTQLDGYFWQVMQLPEAVADGDAQQQKINLPSPPCSFDLMALLTTTLTHKIWRTEWAPTCVPMFTDDVSAYSDIPGTIRKLRNKSACVRVYKRRDDISCYYNKHFPERALFFTT